MWGRARSCVTPIPVIRLVGISDMISISCMIERVKSAGKYRYRSYQALAFDMPAGGSIRRVGYPPIGIASGPAEWARARLLD